MAARDLAKLLADDTHNTLDPHTQRRVARAILKLVRDTNGEVQTQAVKCLAPLLKRVSPEQANQIVQELTQMTVEKDQNVRDIASLALKTVIMEIPQSHFGDGSSLIDSLLNRLSSMLKEVSFFEIYLFSHF